MFEKHREKQAERARERAEQQAKAERERQERTYASRLSEWQARYDEVDEALYAAENFDGLDATDGLILKRGEHLFAVVENVALVETRREPGHWTGQSQGLSIPVGSIGGRSVRYRAGASRGTYAQGAETPTPVDTGKAFITDQRVLFHGPKLTREWLFAKLQTVDFELVGSVTLAVSNRQKGSTLYYGSAAARAVKDRIELALAHFEGRVPELIENLRKELAQLESIRPALPAGASVPAPA